MDRVQAEDLISSVEGARFRTRQQLGSFWFPAMLFGGISAALATALALGATGKILVAWIVLAPVGIVATSLYYARRTHRIGLSPSPMPFLATGIAVGLSAGSLGAIGRGSPLGYAGPMVAIGLGYLVFAWLQRSVASAAFAASVLVVGILLYVLQPPHALVLALAYFGGGSLALGVWNLRQQRDG